MLMIRSTVRIISENLPFVRKMSGSSKCKRLCGKVAVVTASTEGIGYSIAQRLAQEGAKVVISSRKQEKVDKAVQELQSEGLAVTGLVCHVSKAKDRKKLFEEISCQFGVLDILVSNAAVNPEISNVLDASEASWDKIFDTNVKASFMLAKEGLQLLKKSSSGRIIFISSIAGFHPIELLGAYSVSKTALFGLTKAAAQQLGVDNITVNCVAPGIIHTKFSETLISNEDAREESLRRTMLNRLGTPSDISGVVAFLASEDAAYITGETIVPAGGMQSRL